MGRLCLRKAGKLRPFVLLGAESLVAGNGGICRVARLIARVLSEEMALGRLLAGAIVLSDTKAAQLSGFPITTAAGSRLKFVAKICQAAFTRTHFIYDSLGMARAHFLMPFIKRPSMAFIHGIEVWEGTRADRLRAARRVEQLVANTQYTCDRAQRTFGGFANAKVCWLGTETDEPPRFAGIPTGPPRVLIVGHIDKPSYKGHADLIRCWPSVVSAVPEARLSIVGRGPGVAEYQDQAKKSSVSNHIEFLGFVPESEMPRVWSAAHVLAMPSQGEGFGLVYAEAMRHAVPIIASTHDAAQEINVDGQTGFNVNLDKAGDLPERIIYLLRNQDRSMAMGRTGQERWKTHFCFSAFRGRFRPILWEFLGSKDVGAVDSLAPSTGSAWPQ